MNIDRGTIVLNHGMDLGDINFVRSTFVLNFKADFCGALLESIRDAGVTGGVFWDCNYISMELHSQLEADRVLRKMGAGAVAACNTGEPG